MDEIIYFYPYFRTGVFGRSQVVHYAMNLLVSWVFSNEGNEDALFSR